MTAWTWDIVTTLRGETAGWNGPAIADSGGRVIWDYPGLWRRVDRECAGFQAAGIGPGMRVGFTVANSAEYIVWALAILAAGGVLVPFSQALPDNERRRLAMELGVDWMLENEAGLPRLSPLDGGAAAKPPMVLPEGRRAAFIRFSSGTTGASKGVILSHQAVLERTAACTGLRIGAGEAVLWVLDMAFHFVVTILLFLRRRALIVLAAAPVERTMREALAHFPIRLLYATAYHYNFLTGAPDCTPAMLSPVRQAVATAMRFDPADAAAFREKFHLPVIQAYGIIEVGLPCLNDDPERAGSVGRLQAAYELRIVDPEPATGVGAIGLRGPGMFDAYCTPFAWRTELFPDGWFATGDLGRVDSEGYLFIAGRCKNVINFMGMKVFPEAVEAVLNAFPGILTSRVFGIPFHGSELPVAELVPASGVAAWTAESERALRRFCFEHLARYQVPSEFRMVAELPRTASGKILRRKES